MLGIVVTINLFFVVLGSLIFPAPKYENFCTPIAPVPPSPAPAHSLPASVDYTTCQKPFNDAQQQHQLETFILMVGLGVLAIIIGVLPLGSSIVSSGLSYGGVFAFVIGAVQYWSDAGSALRLGISFVALVALLYIGLKRFKD